VKLEVAGTPNATVLPNNAIFKINSTGGNGVYVGNYGATESYATYIQAAYVASDSPVVQYNLILQPNGGNVLVGTTSTTGTAVVHIPATSSKYAISFRGGSTTSAACAFYNSAGGGVGEILIGASSTTYSTSSDYRLKTDAQPMTGASDRVLALKPVNFEWISTGDRVDGFLAHEAQD
jgi:hypothetical protein